MSGGAGEVSGARARSAACGVARGTQADNAQALKEAGLSGPLAIQAPRSLLYYRGWVRESGTSLSGRLEQRTQFNLHWRSGSRGPGGMPGGRRGPGLPAPARPPTATEARRCGAAPGRRAAGRAGPRVAFLSARHSSKDFLGGPRDPPPPPGQSAERLREQRFLSLPAHLLFTLHYPSRLPSGTLSKT